MIDDIVIGKGTKGTTWIALKYNYFISQNSNSYIVKLKDPLEIDVLVYKDHEMGKKLAEMIAQGKSDNLIKDYVLRKAIRHGKVGKIITAIKEYGGECYRRGREEKVNQIKEVLGL